MARCVRGQFFAEYVRMIRRRKDVEWERWLLTQDLAFIRQRIAPDDWYPMETFERLGIAILMGLDGPTLEAVRVWGRFFATPKAAQHPAFLAPQQPIDSLIRPKGMRHPLFNLPAVDIPLPPESHVHAVVTHHLGAL